MRIVGRLESGEQGGEQGRLRSPCEKFDFCEHFMSLKLCDLHSNIKHVAIVIITNQLEYYHNEKILII